MTPRRPTAEEWDEGMRQLLALRDQLNALVKKYCKPDPKDVEIERLRQLVVTIKVNAMRDGWTKALEIYIDEQLGNRE